MRHSEGIAAKTVRRHWKKCEGYTQEETVEGALQQLVAMSLAGRFLNRNDFAAKENFAAFYVIYGKCEMRVENC